MRKRICSLLLTLCLLLSLLPTVALAGGEAEVTTYQQLVSKLSEIQMGYVFLTPASDFGWPESATLTIPANVGIQVSAGCIWEIPKGITVNFETNCYGIRCEELILNGTIHTAYSSQDSILTGCNKVLIGPTGTFSCADDHPDYPTLCGMSIPKDSTWEVLSGAVLEPRIYLNGTLTGSGTVSGQITVQGGFYGTDSNGLLSGNLTLTGGLSVGLESSTYADCLTIPKGSHITITNQCWMNIVNATVNLEGELEFQPDDSENYSNPYIGPGGKLTMNGGKLTLNWPYHFQQNAADWADGEAVTFEKIQAAVPAPLIDGTGTICFQDSVNSPGTESGWIFSCHADLVAQAAEQIRNGSYDPSQADPMTWAPVCMIDLQTIAIERSWACEHIWDGGQVTQSPTCTQPGTMTYTCVKCHAANVVEIPATGHTEITVEAVDATCTTEGKTEGKCCSVCGTVIVAQETIPALGHLWNTNNCAEEATCSRCDAVRPAGQHVWGDWTVDKAATCTATGLRSHTCTSCGHGENEVIAALGHAYQTTVTAPTCTTPGYSTHTCSRCQESYQDEKTAALGHNWGTWVVTKEPTETEEGCRTRTCQRPGCDATQTETISHLAEQAVSWTTDSITWTYGQTNSAQNTAYNDTEGGGDLTYSSSDTQVATVDENGKATIVGAGTATITATAASVPGKYAETSASYTLTIQKAPLIITAKNATITYGEVPSNAGWTGTGYVYGENAEVVTGAAAYSYDYEQFETVGSYAIYVSDLSAKNYEISYAPGTLTVQKAADYTITLGKLEQLEGHTSHVTAQISPWDDSANFSVEYQVNGTWTTVVPKVAGQYPVRALLTSSKNITPNSEAYVTEILTVQASSTVAVGDTTVAVGTTVKDGQVAITVNDEQMDAILDNVDGNVCVDLSGVQDADALILPGNLVSRLSQNNRADRLTVSTEDASIAMSASVLDTIADVVTSESDRITVRLTSVEEEDLSQAQQAALASIHQDALIVEVSLVITHADNTTTELHQLGGNVEVKVPYTGSVPAGKYVVVCYLSDDGNITYVRATYDAETRQISFSTNHFSNYALFVSGQPAVVVAGGSGSGLYDVGDMVTIQADTKSGYRFDGWNVIAGEVSLDNSANAVASFVMPSCNVEVQATYIQESSGGGSGTPTYSITIPSKVDNGTIQVSPMRAARGTTVIITGKPDKGYVLNTVSAKDSQGNELKLIDKGADQYAFTMPGSNVHIEISFRKINEESTNPFNDIQESDYFYEAILWAVEKGVTNGTGSNTFCPDIAVSRAQMVTFLWRAYGSPKVTGDNPFTDVNPTDYYYDAVLWAVANGITNGTSNTTFHPEALVTRSQAVTFQWRAAGSPVISSDTGFSDVAAEAYYQNAVIWAVENNITNGIGDGKFSPETAVSRAQAVTFLYRELYFLD